MCCLFAVSSWFVQRASLTVNIDLIEVTNRYYTVLYRTVVVYEKKNRSLVFSCSRKFPTLGSTVQWETRQALFPTGTVGPRFGIFLSPLNTNDGFCLSYPGCHVRAILEFTHLVLKSLLCKSHVMWHLSIFRNLRQPFFYNKNPLIILGWDRIIPSSWEPFVIT